MNNYHPFLPRASNNTIIGNNMSVNKTFFKKSFKLYFSWYQSGIFDTYIIIRWRKEDFEDRNSLFKSLQWAIKRNMFFNKGLFWRGYKSSRLYSLMAFSLLCLFCSFFWPDRNSHSKIAISRETLPSFAIFRFIDACQVAYCEDSLKKARNLFWLLSSKLPLCLWS